MEVLLTLARYGIFIVIALYIIASMFLVYLVAHAYRGVEKYERVKFNAFLVVDAILFAFATALVSMFFI